MKVQYWGPVCIWKSGCCWWWWWVSSRSGWLLELLTELTNIQYKLGHIYGELNFKPFFEQLTPSRSSGESPQVIKSPKIAKFYRVKYQWPIIWKEVGVSLCPCVPSTLTLLTLTPAISHFYTPHVKGTSDQELFTSRKPEVLNSKAHGSHNLCCELK